MRALRILLIVVVVLGGLFVAADRIAVGFAEDKAADKLQSSEGLADKPDVSIKGFPFLTQIAGGELDDVEIGIKDYSASTSAVDGGGAAGGGSGTIRIEQLKAQMHGVEFSNSFSSATADSATGTARISYPELLKAAQVQPVDVAPGVTAKVVGLSDGGDGRLKVSVEATVFGSKLPDPISVMSGIGVKDNVVRAHAEALPKLPVAVAEQKIREITDFQRRISELPAGIHIDKLVPTADGVDITVKGSHVSLVG